MAYDGNVAPVTVSENLNEIQYDVKTAMRLAQAQIKQLISDMANPDLTYLIIDGRKIYKADPITLNLALTDLMDRLQNQTQSILSVFSELYKMERSIGGGSSS